MGYPLHVADLTVGVLREAGGDVAQAKVAMLVARLRELGAEVTI